MLYCLHESSKYRVGILIVSCKGRYLMKHLIIVGIILFSCLLVIPVAAESPMFAFSVDSQNRPITGCLEIDSHALSSIIISMNCKKTAVPHIYICSQERLVQYYKTQKDCQKARDELSALHGEHTLATDPHETR